MGRNWLRREVARNAVVCRQQNAPKIGRDHNEGMRPRVGLIRDEPQKVLKARGYLDSLWLAPEGTFNARAVNDVATLVHISPLAGCRHDRARCNARIQHDGSRNGHR
jgi:hypothetical protein